MSYQRFAIEPKHIYTNSESNLTQFATDSTVTERALILRTNQPNVGTSDSTRTGNKINPSSLVLHSYFRLPITTLMKAQHPFKPDLDIPWVMHFRFFIVRHDQDFFTDNNACAWFRRNFIYTFQSSTMSNQTKVMRESTADTGKYHIVYDQPFTLSNHKTQIQLNHVHKLSKVQWTYPDSSSNSPSVLYSYFVIPPLSYLDYSDNITALPSIPYKLQWTSNIKLNYVDF